MPPELGTLERLHEALARNGFAGDLARLVHLIGSSGFWDAKQSVEDLLRSEHAELRYAALVVLSLVWTCEDHRTTCERLGFLEPDSDEEVRRAAVAGLGALLEGTRDAKALRLALPIIEDESSPGAFRETAYIAIATIMGQSTTHFLMARQLEWPQGVDWDLLQNAKAIAAGTGN